MEDEEFNAADIKQEQAKREEPLDDLQAQEQGTNVQEINIVHEILALAEERENLIKNNKILQEKLSVFIKGSAEKDYFQKIDIPLDADEGTFHEVLGDIDTKLNEIITFHEQSKIQQEVLKEQINETQEILKELNEKFSRIKETVALQSINSKTGERFSEEEVKALLRKEEEVQKSLQEFQTETIKKRHNLNVATEKKKNLAEGTLDFAEYEVMCIEIDNNTEAIQQIKKKIRDITRKGSNIVKILSHLPQKLYLAQNTRLLVEEKVKSLEDDLKKARNQLFTEKMEYAKMKEKSKELQYKSALLQHPKLLEDYKNVKEENEEIQKHLTELKLAYANTLKIIEH
ncbi:GRIP1-associated protein 1-like [Stegodyphus dumicola]|uniref:GRIP1-associated protein 1-like n=1 Tax=Stegodyphus dumicola TaxID=202533 RepID=UPI0015AA85F1|nr:GRIP1-associated protein 1-like [Stegodyphus dumicola]